MQEFKHDWEAPKPATVAAIAAALADPEVREVRIACGESPEYQAMLSRHRKARKARRRALAKQRKHARR